METRIATHVDTELGRLRGVSWLFLLASVLFFAAIFNPVVFGYFDAATETERLSHVEDNLLALRLVFTGMGVTELALGTGLWLWGRQVADHTPGRRGGVARAFAVVGLVSGTAVMVMRLSAWFEDAQQLASDAPSALEIVLGVSAWIGFSLSIIVLGYLMVRGAMPTWLGVTWIVCGVLFWVGLIPFWFFFAALILGIYGIVKFRPGAVTVEQIRATRSA